MGCWPFPYWLVDFIFERPRVEVVADIKRHLRRLLKKGVSPIVSSFGGRAYETQLSDAQDISGFPEHYRRVAETHYHSLINYKPRVYPGRITLFRARAQPLFSSHVADKGLGPAGPPGRGSADCSGQSPSKLRRTRRTISRQTNARSNRRRRSNGHTGPKAKAAAAGG